MKSVFRLTMLTLISAALFPFASLAQLTFTSPAPCIPADPAQGFTTYTLISGAGNTITSITPLGDLQIGTITPALPATGTITITAKSLNKGRNINNDCIGYLAQSSSQNFGFGRGVLRVNYTTGAGCGLSIDQVINKTFAQTPPIVGPKCIASGDTVTYSVCPILSVNPNDKIGQDVYTWTGSGLSGAFPTGLTEVYRSGDGSSVTFVVTAAWVGGTIYCSFGQCNTGKASLSLGVKTKPSSVTINGGTAVNPNSTACVTTATTPINLVATQPSGSTYTYSWSTNNSTWTFGAGTATATSISGGTVQLNANQSNGAVYLTTLGGCNPRIDTFYINRTLDTATLSVKRLDNATCITPGAGITFFVDNATNTANVGGLTYTWTLPATWSFAGSGSQTASTINTTAGTAGGTVFVKVAGCPSVSLSALVNVTPPAPSAITGAACINQGSTGVQNYFVTNVSGTTYNWSNTATGWTGSSTTSSINYTPSGNTVGTISVTAINGACTSGASSKVINFNPVTPSNINYTGIYVGGACTTVLTATGGQGTTYTWTIPAGFGTIASQTGNQVTVNTVGTAGAYTISVVANNACGTSASFSKNIIVAAPTINYNTLDPTYDVLSLVGASGLTYCWKLNNTGGCLFNTPSILLQNGGAASYTVDITYPCGQHYFITQSTRYSSRSAGGAKNNLLLLKDAVVSPNPASGQFKLTLPANANGMHLRIYNNKGALIQQMTCAGGINNINTNGWSNGEYLLKISADNAQAVTKKVVINK